MQQHGANIGHTVTIKGEISSGEPLSIAGRVEGRVDASGHDVSVEPGGRVDGDLTAATITVSGAVKGSLLAEKRMDLRNTAEVEGDLSAPTLAIAEGAYVLGKVEIAGTRRVVDLPRAS